MLIPELTALGITTGQASRAVVHDHHGLGVAFMSTSKGVMTGQQARRQGVGGELLFYIW